MKWEDLRLFQVAQLRLDSWVGTRQAALNRQVSLFSVASGSQLET